jgi:hypothetical protein
MDVTKRLDKIEDHLSSWKRSKNITIVSDYACKFEDGVDTTINTVYFEPTIRLDSSDYEIGLINLETYYSFPNVDSRNNKFRYYSKAKSTYVILTLDTGAYDIKELYAALKAMLETMGDLGLIRIKAIVSTQKAELTIDKTIVDFTYPNSINTLLGFDSKVYGDNNLTLSYISENIVNIIDITSIYVNTDIVNQSYSNGKQSSIIYSFFPTVSPGYRIVERPSPPVYAPINKSEIDKISFWLTDDKGRRVNFRGETVTMRFYLKKIPLK